jgi:Phage capsid family
MRPIVPEDIRNGNRTRDAAVASLTRAAISIGLGKLDTSVRPAEHARRRGWSDDRNLDLVLRAAVSPATVASTPALTQISYAFLETLVPVSAGADLLGRSIGLNFNGSSQISVPGIALPVADFVGEGAPIPVVQAPTSAAVTLTPFKIAVITSLSGAMMRHSNAEQLVRAALTEACGPALDKALFSTAAAGPDRPAGLLHNIAGLTPAGVGEKSQALVDDLQALATAVAPVAGNSDIVIIAAPAQAIAIKLRVPAALDWPVLISSSLAAGTIIAVAANAVVSALEGTPEIEASTEAAIHMETAPAQVVDIGGIAARPVYSTFQMDLTALKLRWPISWALRSSAGLAWMSGVNW